MIQLSESYHRNLCVNVFFRRTFCRLFGFFSQKCSAGAVFVEAKPGPVHASFVIILFDILAQEHSAGLAFVAKLLSFST